jgi:RND family efflux transporter MFP subunit
VNFKFIRITVFIILILLSGNLAIALAEDNFYVSTVNIDYENKDKTFTGVTEAVHDVILGLSVSGTIDKILFRKGDRVKANTPILYLQKRKEEIEVQLRKLMWKNTARLDITTIREKKLKEILETNKSLFEKNISISEEELIKLELEYYTAYYTRLELENVKEQEKLAYELAKEALARMTLSAPIDGIITDIVLDEGEIYRGNEPLIRIVNPDLCYFVCDIEDNFSQLFKTGEEVILKFKGENQIEKKGKIIFVSPVVDPGSNLMKIKVQFDNSDNAVNPGVAASMFKQ